MILKVLLVTYYVNLSLIFNFFLEIMFYLLVQEFMLLFAFHLIIFLQLSVKRMLPLRRGFETARLCMRAKEEWRAAVCCERTRRSD